LTRYYCSIFSKGYVYRGLLLYESLLRWDKDFHFFMICLEEEALTVLKAMNLKKATVLSLADIEGEDPELKSVRETRNQREYAWTAKASAMLYLFRHYAGIDHLLWLDGDTYFFGDPGPLFEEWGSRSIALNRGRWEKPDRKKTKRYGKFNTGLMGFRRDEEAFRCLKWFRARLLQWCRETREEGRWSDQVYADDWPKRFQSVAVIENIGVNVTPPVAAGGRLTREGGRLYLNGKPLVFYHYSKFTYFNGRDFELCSFVRKFPDEVVEEIYLPYIRACRRVMKRIHKVAPGFYPPVSPRDERIVNYFNLEAHEEAARGGSIPQICTLVTRDFLLQVLALYRSLHRHTPRFRLWILCVDDASYRVLKQQNLDRATLISLKNLQDTRLAKIRQRRQTFEFCWTLKGTLAAYLLKNHGFMEALLYMDADMFFLQAAGEIYRDWGEASVYLTRLWHHRKWERRLGRFSAGLIGFKRDKTGLKCLETWRRQCLQWCYDRFDRRGFWGDQKYLNPWPRLYPGLKISKHRGINVGPWMLRQGYELQREGGVLQAGGRELVCYHFSGFVAAGDGEFILCRWRRSLAGLESVYDLYTAELRSILAGLSPAEKGLLPLKGEKRP
jgi:hypothetical protein